MKTKATLTALWGCVAALCLGACGSSSSSTPAPTPTSTNTKAASSAAVGTSNSATSAGVAAGITEAISMNLSAKSLKTMTTKDAVTETINITCPSDSCAAICEDGTITVTGDMTADASAVGDNWTATFNVAPLTITFTDCEVSVTTDSTTKVVLMNGSALSSLSGTASGTDSTVSELEFSGTLSGTPTLTGEIEGTVDLDSTTYSGSGAPTPTITCAGTSTVTIDDTEQVCTVASDCSGCTE